ncbi:MAG TPA: FtsX-like permease family protein [Thermomicrobiales bacterium]|nr:FtsX-like permease family protein [Thermomicrobiales bacterium]
MENLFGIPMQSIMVVMVVLLVICLLAVAFIAWRRPVIFKLGVRNIPRRKAQTTLIIVGLMLATLIISAALGTGDTLNRSGSAQVYDLLGPVDEVIVASNDGDGEGEIAAFVSQTIPELTVDTVRDMVAGSPDVDAVGGILVSTAPTLNVKGNAPAGFPTFDEVVASAVQSEPAVSLAGIDPESFEALGGATDLQGNRVDFAGFGERDVLLSKTGAEDLDAQVGDYLVVAIRNVPVVLHVAAIADDSVLTGTVNTMSQPAMSMHLAPLQDLTGNRGRISGIGVSNAGDAREGLARTDAVVNLLKPQLAPYDLLINTIKQDNVDQAELIANVFVTVFVVFGLFSISVGILLIVLIFTMLAAERRSEMGMERAVGAQRRQLIQQFIAEGAGYTLLSGLAGTLLGGVIALGIGVGLQRAFGDLIKITPYVQPRSLVIAYALGVVITFLAVGLASWRVSHLNVVAAVRDIPELYRAKQNRRQLVWGVIMMVAGALLVIGAQPSRSMFMFSSGMTLIPFGLAAIVTYVGWRPRWVLTGAGLYALVFWLLPEDTFQSIFGEYTGNIEMFFLSGVCIVAASTLVIMQNFDWLVSGVERLGGRSAGWLPAIRLATSYPTTNKGRTGMTIAMFSLIVFSLVVVAAINENFSAAFLSEDATAGWDVSVQTSTTNPVPDLNASLQGAGYDTSRIAALGEITVPAQSASTVVRNPAHGDTPADAWKNGYTSVLSASYLDHATLKFGARAAGYDSDAAIVEALRTEPDVMVLDTFSLASEQGFGGDPSQFTLNDVQATGTFDAPTVEVRQPDGTIRQVRVIGVISSNVSSLVGLFVGPPTGDALFARSGEPQRTWFVQLAPGVDISAAATDIERALLPSGVQANDIRAEMEDAQQQQRSFLYIMQAFMGLGLIVGIAAVGVIAFRAVVERRQEIGMLRAIGFQRAVISRAFVIESAVIVIIGVLAGAIFGLILSWMLVTSDQFSSGTQVDFLVPWDLILVTLATAIVAALLMAWLPARRAARVLPAEALRYE